MLSRAVNVKASPYTYALMPSPSLVKIYGFEPLQPKLSGALLWYSITPDRFWLNVTEKFPAGPYSSVASVHSPV